MESILFNIFNFQFAVDVSMRAQAPLVDMTNRLIIRKWLRLAAPPPTSTTTTNIIRRHVERSEA